MGSVSKEEIGGEGRENKNEPCKAAATSMLLRVFIDKETEAGRSEAASYSKYHSFS